MVLSNASGSINIEVADALNNLERLEGGLRRFDQSAQGGMTGLASAVDRNAQHFNAAGQALTALGGVGTAAFGFMVNAAANFEQSMSGVEASLGGVGTATGITKQQFEALRQEALDIGSTTSKSATEASRAMELMAKAGVDVETILNGGARAAVNVSEATGEMLEQSASTMSTLSILFKDTGISAQDMGDVIVNAMNMSDATMSEFQTGMARLAPAIKGGTLAANEAAAALVYFNAQGFSAAEVGTSLSSIFTSVVAPATDEAAAALENAGIQAFDAQGAFIGFPALFDQVAAATAGMTEEQKANFLATAFMTDGIDLLNTVTGETGDNMRQMETDIAQTGTAAEASRIRMDNLKGSIEQMRGAIETVAIRIGSYFLPAIRAIVDGITALLTAFLTLPDAILAPIVVVAALASALALLGGLALLAAPQIAGVILAVARFRAWGGISQVVATLAARLGVMGGSAGILRTAIALATRAVFLFAGALRSLLFANPIMAALTLGFLAFQTNFLGFGDAVRGVMGGVTGFIDRFRSAFEAARTPVSDVMQQVNKIGGLASGAARPVNILSAAFDAVAIAIRGINGGDIPDWLDRVADGFEGAADAVENVVDIVLDAVDAFDSTSDSFKTLVGWTTTSEGVFAQLESTVNSVSVFLYSLGAALRSVAEATGFEWLNVFAAGLDAIGSAIEEVIGHFEGLRNRGIAPIEAALFALGLTFPVLYGAMSQAASVVRDLTGAFSEFVSGDYGTGFRLIGEAAQTAWTLVRDGIGALGEIAGSLGTVAIRIGAWVFEQAVDLGTAFGAWLTGTAIPAIGTAARSLGTFAVEVADWAVTAAVDLGGKVAGWITGTALPAVDKAARSLGTFGVEIAGWLVSAAIDLGVEVASWIQNTALPAVDKASRSLGTFLVEIAGWLVTSATSLAERVSAWITGTAISAVDKTARDLGTFLANIAGWLITTTIDLADKVANWITNTAIPAVDKTARDLGTFIVNIAGWLVTEAEPLAIKVASWIQEQIGNVAKTATTNIDELALAIKNLSVAMGEIPLIGPGVSLALSAIAFATYALSLAVEGLLPDLQGVNTELENTSTQAPAVVTALNDMKAGWAGLPAPVKLAGTSFFDAAVALTTLALGARLLAIPLRAIGALVAPLATVLGVGVAPAVLAVTLAIATGLFTWRALEDNMGGVYDKSVPLYEALQDAADALIRLGQVIGLLVLLSWETIKAGIDGIKTAIQGVKNAVGLAATGVTNLYNGLVSMKDLAFDTIVAGIDKITSAIDAVKSAAETAATPILALIDAYNSLKGVLGGVGEEADNTTSAIERAGLAVGEFVKLAGGAFAEALVEQNTSPSGIGISGRGGANPAQYGMGPSALADLQAAGRTNPFQFLIDGASRAVESVRQTVTDIGATLGSAPSLWAPPVQTAALAVQTAISTGITGAGTAAGTALAGITSQFQTQPSSWSPPVAAAGLAISTSLGSSLTTLSASVGTGLDGINTTIGTKSSIWGTTLSTALANLGGGGVAGAGAAVGAAAGGLLGNLATSLGLELDGINTTIGTKAASWGTTLATSAATLGASATTAFAAIPLAVGPPLMAAGMAVATQTALMATSASMNFMRVSTSAATSMAATGISIGTAATAMSVRLAGALAGMAAASALRFAAIRTSAVTQTASMASGVGAQISSMASSSAARTLGMQMGIAARFTSMRSSAVSAATGMSSSVVSTMASMASRAASVVQSGLGRIPGIVSSIGRSAAGAARSAGAAISQGFAQGMESALGRIRAAANAMVQAANDAVRARAIIASPSKLFARLGEYLGEGFALGIEHMVRRTASAARDLLGAATGAMDGIRSIYAGVIPAVASPGIGAVTGSRGTESWMQRQTDLQVQQNQTLASLADAVQYRQMPQLITPSSAMNYTINNSPTITVVQRPGEDSEALAERLEDRIFGRLDESRIATRRI